ncbi:MAG TPA: TolC family protein [Bacteriovoracaceae bacterium]|nr:TolC family protein [Bacteriovoracaceae bacterium]
MKKWILPLLISMPSFASVSLKDAYTSAKDNMETIKKANAQLNQAEARKNVARASFLPTISFEATDTRIDQPTAAGINRAFVLTRQYSAAMRLRQPLIRGGVLSGYQLRDEEYLLAQFQKDYSYISLYQLLINAYYNLYLAQIDLKNLQELRDFSEERLKEIASLARVGRSRQGELVQAETQLLTAKAQYEQGLQVLKEAQENFAFYTGKTNALVLAPTSLPKKLQDFSFYLDKLNSRPDILAAQQELRIAGRQVDVSKGGHYPSVDLVGNYYFDRTGVLQTSEWDVGVQVSVPLFQGGSVISQVKEATEAKRVAELNTSEKIRQAKTDLSVFYKNYHQIQIQLSTLKEALKKAEQAYKLNQKDYRYGQVTNLEVLQSLNLFIETKRSYDNLLILAHMTFKNLEASAGVLP